MPPSLRQNRAFPTPGSINGPLPGLQAQTGNNTTGTPPSIAHIAAVNRVSPGLVKNHAYLENKNKAERASVRKEEQAKNKVYPEGKMRGQAAEQGQEETILKTLAQGKARKQVNGV